MASNELFLLLNLFQNYAPANIYQDYFNAFSRISEYPWYFPGDLLFGISDALRVKKVEINIGNPESWEDLFNDLSSRFKTVKSQLNTRKDSLSQRLQHVLVHIDNYLIHLEHVLSDNRRELFKTMAQWGIKCLEQLSSMIKDNLLIMGGGPVGLMTAYFLQKNIPSFKTVVLELRPKYTRDYHVLLTEDTFETLPLEIKQGLWGRGRFGCYILPPPIDAKGFCYINPPRDVEVPSHFASTLYPNEFFDINPVTSRRTFKKLMSIPIGVFETAMEELLRVKYPEIKIIKPKSESESDMYDIDNTAFPKNFGLNKISIVNNQTRTVLHQNLFTNDAMYNFIVDASGADSSLRQDERKKQEFHAVNDGFDLAMSIIIENNFDHLRLNLTGENVNLNQAQDNSRFFTNNERWKSALLSVREFPDQNNLHNLVQSKENVTLKWTDISDDNKKHINKVYKSYTGKDLDSKLVKKINVIRVQLGLEKNMYAKEDNGMYRFTVGDAACAVHFFSGTGINNGISMATKLTEMLNKAYQSRWQYDMEDKFSDWNTKMNDMCKKTLEKSERFLTRTFK
jgi:2-polyprenyl-6-methoxyphenol hydroxylase-like FAD-dependent oxidoreductase